MAPSVPVLSDTNAAAALVAALADAPVEIVEALYIDPKWRLCGKRRFTGTVGDVAVSVRSLVEGAFAANAAYVILAHNHPSGDAEPSKGDLVFTRRLADALALLEMPLADHLIVGRGEITSMRARGLL